jgi:hypothetical protein
MNTYYPMVVRVLLTGALGFEPRDGGTKTRCLTAWLRPIDRYVLMLYE